MNVSLSISLIAHARSDHIAPCTAFFDYQKSEVADACPEMAILYTYMYTDSTCCLECSRRKRTSFF